MRPSQSIFDYARLRGAIREYCGTEGAFAAAIGRSPNYISKVFQGKSNFDAMDISRSAEVLEIEQDEIGRYFFTRECRRIEIKQTGQEKSREGMRMSFLHGSFLQRAPGGAHFLSREIMGSG